MGEVVLVLGTPSVVNRAPRFGYTLWTGGKTDMKVPALDGGGPKRKMTSLPDVGWQCSLYPLSNQILKNSRRDVILADIPSLVL